MLVNKRDAMSTDSSGVKMNWQFSFFATASNMLRLESVLLVTFLTVYEVNSLQYLKTLLFCSFVSYSSKLFSYNFAI